MLVGRPMRSERLGGTLLPKRIALPVFASDALSSVAYAPDEVLLTLALAGTAALTVSPWVGLAVVVVMVTVVASYRQTVHAYPSGGGDYEVATDNLGPRAGLTVAAALLVDYVLTVAVSVSSGVQYLAAAVPATAGHEVAIAVGVVVVLTLLNLRGVREAGTGFAIPVYLFMGAIGLMAVAGFIQAATGTLHPAPSAGFEISPDVSHEQGLTGLAGAFLVLRAFSSGSAALTGVEAISNGVPAFRKPKSANAATTLLLLGTISATMLLSILFLAGRTGVRFVQDPARQAHPRRRPGDRLPAGPGHRSDRRRRLRRRAGAVLPGHRGHRHHPRARRQHRLQRLPGARLGPGPGRLPAAPPAHPRGPAGLLQRHHRPRGGRRPPHRPVRRRGHPAHPGSTSSGCSSPSRSPRPAWCGTGPAGCGSRPTRPPGPGCAAPGR